MSKRRSQQNRRTAGSIVIRILLWFFVLILTVMLGFGIWFYVKYGKDLLQYHDRALEIAATSKRADFANAQTSICYYSDGSIMQILSGEKNVYYLPFESIPKSAVDAVIAIEDRKFYSHKGYDIYAIGRAAKAFILNDGAIKQGGSTITQQLARMIYLTNEKTIERKVTEIFLASALERKYSKEDILEFYLNNMYFANGYYGLQAAAEGYFGKAAGDLSLSQLAFLCGIPNSPSSYNPRTRFDNTLLRRNSVLEQMKITGVISEEEYLQAVDEDINLAVGSSSRNNYEETYTYRCAIHALMESEGFEIRYNFSDDEDKTLYEEYYNAEYSKIWRNLYSKGYRIYTSINPAKQELLQKAVDDGLSDFNDIGKNGVYKLQGAGVCIDNDTGMVVAIVGGRSQKAAGYTLNRAFQSPRQPGSSIKPLIVYTPAFEQGYYPDTTVVDEKFEGGPRNSGGVYSGEIDIRYAIRVSKNTVAWKLFEELGIDSGLRRLKNMDFASIAETDYYPAASLGGLTYGATAVEMTSAFAALENKGEFRNPTCILRITDTYGKELVNNTGNPTPAVSTMNPRRIYEKNASLMMTDTLTTVMKEGTGRKVSLSGISCAGKTGTTTNQKDGWFVGYTGYYTTGIWVGCDYPEKVEELMGSTYPGRIWQSFMQEIHEGLPDKPFEPYVDDRPKPLPDENTDDEDEIGNADDEDEIGNTDDEDEIGNADGESEAEDGENSETVELEEIEQIEEEPIDTPDDDVIWISPANPDSEDVIWIDP